MIIRSIVLLCMYKSSIIINFCKELNNTTFTWVQTILYSVKRFLSFIFLTLESKIEKTHKWNTKMSESFIAVLYHKNLEERILFQLYNYIIIRKYINTPNL